MTRIEEATAALVVAVKEAEEALSNVFGNAVGGTTPVGSTHNLTYAYGKLLYSTRGSSDSTRLLEMNDPALANFTSEIPVLFIMLTGAQRETLKKLTDAAAALNKFNKEVREAMRKEK